MAGPDFAESLKALDTTLSSVEQVVDLDGGDDIYNWPVSYGVEVGHWQLPDDQAAHAAHRESAHYSVWAERVAEPEEGG